MANGDLFAAGAFAALGAFMIVIFIAFYIYWALVWSTIAKKLNYDKPWLAWIPIVQVVLFPILAGKKWPWVFIFLVPIVGYIFMIIWQWKIFELRKYPGWLSLVLILTLIPFINWLAEIAYLVILGLVAWKDM